MPNWCSQSIAIYAKEKSPESSGALKKVYSLLNEIKEAKTKCWDIYELFLRGYNIERPEGTDVPDILFEKGYIRGNILDYKWFDETDDCSPIRLDIEVAWEPIGNHYLRELVKAITNCDLLDLVYIAEECGLGIYVNTDVEGEFFPDRYYVDTCVDDNYESEYFPTLESACKWVNEILNPETECHTLDDIEEFFETLNDGDDNFAYIHEYTEE